MSIFGDIRNFIEVDGRVFARRFVPIMRALRLTPNVITCLGTFFNGLAAVFVVNEMWLIAAAIFVWGSLLDVMDGAVATVTGHKSPFGGFLDSTLDRISEGLVLGGLGLYFADAEKTWALGACFIALACSYLVSYTRARAEALGVECKVGIASRIERVIVLTAGLVFASQWLVSLEVAIYILAATSAITVMQRILHVRKSLKSAVAV